MTGQAQKNVGQVANEKEDSKKQNQGNISTGSEEKPLEVDEKENVEENSVESSESREGLNKRSSSSTESTDATPSKKIRNKPKPQIIEDMKEYVNNDTLDKLTTTTLRHWLKERSIHCTTREKKIDLVEKVRKLFAASS